MLFNLEISEYPKEQYFIIISYGDKKRIIKRDELANIIHSLNAYFKKKLDDTFNEQFDVELSCDLSKNYCFTLEESDCVQISNLIETYHGKTRIELPSDLSRSKIKEYDLVYTYSNLTEYSDYWKKESSKLPLLLKQLSDDIIENPYADNPTDYAYRFAKFAFHVNHGSAHGLRQFILIDVLIHYLSIYSSSTTPLNDALQSLRKEEIACLQLAMFLFRSGRTSELGWSGDPSYSPRSAAIFSNIALALGFDNAMVKVMSQCFNFKEVIALEETFLQQNLDKSIAKARLYQTLFHIVHTLELTRCFTDRVLLKEQISEELVHFLDSDASDKLLVEMFSLEDYFLQKTGSANACKTIETKGIEGTENGYLQVRTVDELTLIYEQLQTVARNLPWFSLEYKEAHAESSLAKLTDEGFSENEWGNLMI